MYTHPVTPLLLVTPLQAVALQKLAVYVDVGMPSLHATAAAAKAAKARKGGTLAVAAGPGPTAEPAVAAVAAAAGSGPGPPSGGSGSGPTPVSDPDPGGAAVAGPPPPPLTAAGWDTLFLPEHHLPAEVGGTGPEQAAAPYPHDFLVWPVSGTMKYIHRWVVVGT